MEVVHKLINNILINREHKIISIENIFSQKFVIKKN